MDERDAFLASEPAAEPYLKPFVGAREYLQGGMRWILALHDAKPNTLASLPLVRERMTAHMAWMRAVTGRMKSDYMYSVGVVYKTYPMPDEGADLQDLNPLAQAVLDARAAHSDATLADLYDQDLMPHDLRKAHQALDRAVDKLYCPKKFASERERVEHLFVLMRGWGPLHSRNR